jgi:hypothetical protein
VLADNAFQVKVDAIDEARLMEGMQKVANRIALGLVLAALIVGAALMMDVHPVRLPGPGDPAVPRRRRRRRGARGQHPAERHHGEAQALARRAHAHFYLAS